MIHTQQILYNDINEHKDIHSGHGWRTFKFYKIVITGSLQNDDYISHIDVDIDSIYDEKLR